MKNLMMIAAVAVLGGCLSSAPPAPTYWTIDTDPGTMRYSDVVISAPYDRQELAVLRPDGSIAFDDYNAFAARPSQLLRAGAREGMGPEIRVRRLALDCRVRGKRLALVEIEAESGGKIKVISASASTPSGNYTHAFTEAFGEALKKIAE